MAPRTGHNRASEVPANYPIAPDVEGPGLTSSPARVQAREHDANGVVADLAVEFRERRFEALRAVDLGGRGHALAHFLRHPREDRLRPLRAHELREVLRH